MINRYITYNKVQKEYMFRWMECMWHPINLMMTSSNSFRVTGLFSSQRPVTRSLGVFFYLRPNKRVSNPHHSLKNIILFWLPARWATGFSGDHQQDHQCLWLLLCYSFILSFIACILLGIKLLLLVNNGEPGDSRRHRTHYDVTVLWVFICVIFGEFLTNIGMTPLFHAAL